jgi:hypothetical protein
MKKSDFDEDKVYCCDIYLDASNRRAFAMFEVYDDTMVITRRYRTIGFGDNVIYKVGNVYGGEGPFDIDPKTTMGVQFTSGCGYLAENDRWTGMKGNGGWNAEKTGQS